MQPRPVEFYSNPFLPFPILQGKWEFEKLLDIFKKHKPMKTLEIGSFYGGTLWHWIKNSPPKSNIVSVDMLVPEHDPRREQQEVCRNRWFPIAFSEDRITLKTFLGDSSTEEAVGFMEQYAPYDFIFIDGNHSYDGVKKDFDNALKMAAPGAIIVLHDILPAIWWTSIEVWRLWNEIVDEGYVTQALYSNREQFYGETMSSFGIGVVRL